MPLAVLADAAGEAVYGSRRAIQDVLLVEGALAVRLSENSTSLPELADALVNSLGQNSIETRRRYAQSLLSWFLPDGIDGFLPAVWRTYHDESILADLLRYAYLAREPIVAACVSDALFPLENGISIPASYFDKFLNDHMHASPPEKTRERLKTNLKRLGFLDRTRGKLDRLRPVTPQKASFLILLHHLFAPTSVRSVELSSLLANPFWKYLGFKSEDVIRALLREADAVGVIGKYVVADQLEQVTTCFSLSELLQRRVRI